MVYSSDIIFNKVSTYICITHIICKKLVGVKCRVVLRNITYSANSNFEDKKDL